MPALEFGEENIADGLLKSSEDWVWAHKLPVLLSLLGIIFVGGGLFYIGNDYFQESKVEILPASGSVSLNGVNQIQIMAEISGSVEKPGVYKLNSDARVEDLLTSAGGLQAQADRAWVEKNVNRAQKLVDGQKIYIPKMGEKTTDYSLQSTAKGKSAVAGGQSTVDAKININSASLQELDSLPGIGSVRAQAIIDNRPYSTVDDLITKKVIPKSVFDKVKDQIVAQ